MLKSIAHLIFVAFARKVFIAFTIVTAFFFLPDAKKSVNRPSIEMRSYATHAEASNGVTIVIGILVIAVVIVALVAYLRLDEPFTVTKDDSLHVYDYTFRDDHNNTFVVTAADLEDAFDLLVSDHGLNYNYINKHVFLTDANEVF